MIRHFLVAALRNMAANKVLTTISCLGLSVGLTAALLTGLVLRNQLSYNHFIANYDRVYLALSALSPPGRPADYNTLTNARTASLAAANISGIASATRLLEKDGVVRRGPITASEKIAWADASLFDVLPMPVRSGTISGSLAEPDRVVIAQSVARKYFGSDQVLGRTIDIDGRPMTIMAVIEDLPANATDLDAGIFAAGHSVGSPLLALDRPLSPRGFGIDVKTYFRLKPGADIARVKDQMRAQLPALLPPFMRKLYSMPLVRIDRLALFDGLHPGIGPRLAIAALVGFLVLFVATANYVNLSLARSLRREREVGIRKVGGASRLHLIAQFLSESGIVVLLAALVAVALSELLLPKVNSFLETGAIFDYWRDPGLIAALLVGVIGLSLAAGFYPAFLLSVLPPARVLRGQTPIEDRWPIRRSLVILQFAILTGLLISAGVVYQQRAYAIGPALRVPTDGMLIVNGRCPAAFRDEVRKLQGVAGASCSGQEFLTGAMFAPVQTANGSVTANYVSTEYTVFALYGLRPVAGQLSSAAPGTDGGHLVINEAAVRAFGFPSAQAAIGRPIPSVPASQGIIAAVVPDFALYSVDAPIMPTIYRNETAARRGPGVVQILLKGTGRAETLAAIDQLWRMSGQPSPIDRTFLNQTIDQLYLNLRREGELLTLFGGLAIFLACIGLAGIAAAAAETRIKEIGIRKAMGAGNRDILLRLWWQFTQPVLWANFIAWPLAFWAMNRWLNGFAYHTTMPLWLFPAVGAATLVIALLTVLGQALLVARQKPVLALRYE